MKKALYTLAFMSALALSGWSMTHADDGGDDNGPRCGACCPACK